MKKCKAEAIKDEKFFDLLVYCALFHEEISEGRAVELLGASRDEIRDEVRRRVGSCEMRATEVEQLRAMTESQEAKIAAAVVLCTQKEGSDIETINKIFEVLWK